MRNKSSLPPAARRAAVAVLWLMAAACTQTAVKGTPATDTVPALSPKGAVSLKYPNPWDTNQLIALSNDGGRLIDASRGARNIRVWDWENNVAANDAMLEMRRA